MEDINKFDSTDDVIKHKERVQKAYDKLEKILNKRIESHDDSKLKEPEKSLYDKYIPQLRELKFGSPEHQKLIKEMKENGWDHHAENNAHHPEHHKNGISSMTLVDIFEMFCDHIAASQISDTGYLPGNEFNAKRFNYPEELKKIFANTYNEYF